jgi:hypothetical protein
MLRKQYRELKEDIANYGQIDYSADEQQDMEVYHAGIMQCDVKGATIELNESSAINFDLQYSYREDMDSSTGCHDTSHCNVEIQVKWLTDREGNLIDLKDNQKFEIEKLLEGVVEI